MDIEDAPKWVTQCSCSICRKLGVLWAYYRPEQVHFLPPVGATSVYLWNDRVIAFHSCAVCGCTTHWSPVDKSLNRMAVNARLMEPAVLAAASVDKIDGPS